MGGGRVTRRVSHTRYELKKVTSIREIGGGEGKIKVKIKTKNFVKVDVVYPTTSSRGVVLRVERERSGGAGGAGAHMI
jgi:hypothetical protein